MNSNYRVQVYKDDVFWCSIDIDHPKSKIALSEIISLFSAAKGFKLGIYEASDERRITITGPEGTKLLSREVIYKENYSLLI